MNVSQGQFTERQVSSAGRMEVVWKLAENRHLKMFCK